MKTLDAFLEVAFTLISTTPLSEARYSAFAYFYGYQDACLGHDKVSQNYILDTFAQHWQSRVVPCTQAYHAGYSACSTESQTHGAMLAEFADVLRAIQSILDDRATQQ